MIGSGAEGMQSLELDVSMTFPWMDSQKKPWGFHPGKRKKKCGP